MSYEELVQANQRRVVLELLEQDPDYSHNETVIKSALKSVGHNISTDQLRTQLAWLQEQGLVTVERILQTDVARLTARGQDVATGAIAVPGVGRKVL